MLPRWGAAALAVPETASTLRDNMEATTIAGAREVAGGTSRRYG